MVDVEYVARVVIERIERSIQPKGTVVRRSVTTTEDKVVRDKSEVASFTVRAADPPGINAMVVGVLRAALPAEQVKGEPDMDDDEEEEDL